MDERLRLLSLKAEKMKETLVAREPALEHFFVPIALAGLSEVVDFLPIRCFRQFSVFAGELPPSGRVEDVFSFVSSGSTNDKRGTHYFSPAGLSLYAKGTAAGFESFLKRFGFSRDVVVLSLVPHSSVWPQSSLAAMIGMLSDAGFSVEYVHANEDLRELEAALKNAGDEVIVFGTSFHHVAVERLARKFGKRNLFLGNKMGVVDTGGTKGRTEAFTQDEISQFVRNVYGEKCALLFLSEYGMCELASQAWAVSAPHNGTFACNNTLTAFAIDASFTRLCEPGETGFLAFADSMNTDSYPFIITEDLGVVRENLLGDDACSRSVFTLQGRAPDASLKGCSLNVRSTEALPRLRRSRAFAGFVSKICHFARRGDSKIFEADAFSRVNEKLARKGWSAWDLNHLKSTLRDVGDVGAFPGLKRYQNGARGKVAQIVASANIPITWVLPALAAAWLGYREFHINMPTMRADDAFSADVNARIEDLVGVLRPELFPMELSLHPRRMAHPDEFGADVVVVFGSDATCETFAQMQPFVRAKILPFGDVWNALEVENDEAGVALAAEACTAWRGRGCLTPAAIFMNENNLKISEFCENLAGRISRQISAEALRGPQIGDRFLHSANLVEIRARLKSQGVLPESVIHSAPGSWVVNLANAPRPWEFPIRTAGSGLVFVLSSSQRSAPELAWLNFYNCFPRLQTPHMGKTWFEWLGCRADYVRS